MERIRVVSAGLIKTFFMGLALTFLGLLGFFNFMMKVTEKAFKALSATKQ